MKKILIGAAAVFLVIILVWLALPKNRIFELKEGEAYLVFRFSKEEALRCNALEEFLEYMENSGYRFIPDPNVIKGEMDYKKRGEDYILKDISPHFIQIWPFGGASTGLVYSDQIPKIHYAETVDELEASAGHKLNNIESFTVTAASVSADSCDLTYSNQTERLYDAGAEFWLYAKDAESGWYRLPYKESDIPLAIPMSAYPVAPGKERTDHYNIEAYYGTLPDGEYCMVVGVLPERDDDRYPEEKDTNIVELKTYFTVYFTIPAESQTAEMAEWNAYLASMADKAELFTSVDFVTIYDEPLKRTLYQYTTEEGESFTFTDQKELRAYAVENWLDEIPEDLPVRVETGQEAADVFARQFPMAVPNLEQYEIIESDYIADLETWEVILARKRGEYLQDEITLMVRKDGKVVSFTLFLPQIDSYTEEQYTRDYNEAVEAIKNRYSNRNLERCELADFGFDTYDDGICAATYTFYCSTSQFMKGTKYEAAFAEECRIIVRP